MMPQVIDRNELKGKTAGYIAGYRTEQQTITHGNPVKRVFSVKRFSAVKSAHFLIFGDADYSTDGVCLLHAPEVKDVCCIDVFKDYTTLMRLPHFRSLSQRIMDKYFDDSIISSKEALISLYNSLLGLLSNQDDSNDFIIYVYNKKLELTSDCIVHILNAFKPIKGKLEAWEKFVDFCQDSLTKSIGEKRANQLIKLFA